MTFTTPHARPGPMLRPAEAAAMLGVDPKTLHRWEARGYLTAARTPGGHRRYHRAEVEALLADARRVVA